MANQYKSFYLRDIQNIINKVALEEMKTPGTMIEGRTADPLAIINERYAHYNAGIRALAIRLNSKLEEDDPDA